MVAYSFCDLDSSTVRLFCCFYCFHGHLSGVYSFSFFYSQFWKFYATEIVPFLLFYYIYTYICHGILASLQLRLRLDQFFNLLKLIKEVQAVWVQQRAAWFDRLAANDLLDGQLDLFTIDSSL